MSKQAPSRKNIIFVLVGVAAVLTIGLVAAKIVVENKIKARALEDLGLYEPYLHLESAKVEASYLSSSVTMKDIVYSIPELPELSITIEKSTQEGIDRDTLMGRPGALSTLKKATVSNVRVHAKEMPEPVMEIGHYEVTDMAYPYRDARAALLEAKGGDALALLKALAPIMQDMTMESGPGVMRDVKINLNQAGFFDFYLAEIVSSGFKALDKEAGGYDGILESARYNGIRISSEMYDGSEVLATVDSMEIKGFKYNYKEMLAAIAGYEPGSDPSNLLLAALPTLYNYSFDGINVDGLSVSALSGLFTLESIKLGPRSLKKQGPNIASNMKFSLAGSDVFSLEAAGLDKVVLSDILAQVIQSPGNILDNKELLEMAEENPFMLIDGFRLENLYVKNFNAPGLVNLENWRGDAVFADNKAGLASRLDKLHVSQKGLQQLGVLAMFFSPTLHEALGVMAANPDGVTLDSVLNLDMDIEPAKINYALKFDLAERLGALYFGITGDTAQPGPYDAYGPPLFDLMELRLTDNGMLERVFAYFAGQGVAASAAEVRVLLADELNEEIIRAKPGEVGILRGLQSFVRQGGTLALEITPKRPMRLEDADIFEGTDDLEIRVEHSK